MKTRAWAAVAAAMGAALAGATAAHAQQVSFARDIVPVLRTRCATCHLTGDEPGGMKLYPAAAYRSIVKVRSKGSPLQLVVPGDPAGSYLLHKIEGTHLDSGGNGVRMPFAQPPLEDETRDRIRAWIADGAKDN
ncbi:hypothetical protein SAMN05421829_12213 [Aromatoleum tolulyticum]|uniref:Cytochrome c domain-containing protein n=1 Tax=Aromatoleum tolulyticum TaxID=34027 RepID=A0A1N7C5K5_9RHOO|nr:hypothetical protein [Aromatoleum tolulyticum]SIR58921.1 hypothetical protein SAMN05421829_12213 [Aromatoleum tolulyticum]